MDALAINDLRAIDTQVLAHDMQARAQRGLLWALGISLAIHLLLAALQVGGDSFGWRAPTSGAPADGGTRINARLERAAAESPAPAEAPPTAAPLRSEAPTPATTVTVTPLPSIPK